MRKSATLAIAALLLSTAGCATIINGTTQPIAVTSTPNGARVVVDGQGNYSTPTTIDMERGRDHMLTFTKPGYEDETMTIKHVLSGAVIGNVLAGGLIGWGVDAMDGAQDRLTPDTVQMTLNPVAVDPPVRHPRTNSGD